MHKTHFLSRAMLLVFFVVGSLAGMAQVTLTATSGTASGSFTTLKGAFDAINLGTHKGDIVIKINSSTTEAASASLTASAALSTSAPYYTSINIYPTTTGLSITGASTLTVPLINLNGADNVIIDGRVNATGSTKSLVITNTSTSTSAPTIQFINDATSNTVRYCTLKGSTTATAGGVIFFSTATTTGNDNNTITNNDITCAADGSRPLNVVFASGTSTMNNDNNTISNNNIYNFLSKTTASQGINISSHNSGYTISGNSFYETASFTATGSVNYNVILISAATGSGNGFTVSGNYIGGSAASCGGTAWTKTALNTAFTAISVTTATGTANSIQGNTIQNFNWTNAGTAAFTGISLSGATVANIGTVTGNTIGAATGTGSITYTSSVTAANVYGINIASTDVVDCRNNTIGAITAANAATNATNFFGIVKSSTAGTTTISSNTIGSTSTASSINASSASSTAANIQSVFGIQSAGTGTVTISGNTIANMVNATSNTTTTSAGLISGIYVSAGTNTISDNTVRNLSNSNRNTSITQTASVSGIVMINTTAAAQTVSGNTVYGLSNSNTGFAGGVIGIYYNGPTTASTVSRNFIHSLSVSSSSTTADLYGIKINAGATTYSNNIISLGGNTTTDLFGIYQTGAASNTSNLYFNTVYLSGTLASGSTNFSYALFSTGISNTRNFRNNILVNARSTTGGSNKHCALYLSVLTTPPTLNYNNYFVSGTGGVLGLSGTVASPTADATLPFITGQDANSIVTNPTFSSAGGTTAADYTPAVPGTAVTVLGITDDYAGNTRATNVTMGALEVKLGPDAPTAPVATVGVLSASVAFTAPTNVGGGAITGYQYSLDNGVNWITPSPAVMRSPIFVGGMTPCTDYAIKIRAVNATGGGTASASVNVTTKNGQKAVTWTARSSASDLSWTSVTYGNGLFVAIPEFKDGTGNQVMTSPDGITWTSRTSAADIGWRSVTYGNGLFVAVSTSGTGSNRVMTSPDGITWTLRTSASINFWNSVTYGNGLFVAVSSSGTGNRVMTSPDGITWTARSSAVDNDWFEVTYGNGLFVAVSLSGTGNRVMTSPDGITWTARSSAADNNWMSVTYGNGLFVAVSGSGTQRVMTSPDGITWTIRSTVLDMISWMSVIYGNGIFVAVSGSSYVMTSPDGITWTSRTAASSNEWNSVTYGNGLFVAVAQSGTGNRVMTGADEFAPGNPTITAITPRDVYASIAFTAPASTGYSAITGYEHSIDGGSTWVTPSPAVTASPYRISGLSSGTAYPIQLRAVNSMGSGCGSATFNTTTLVPVVPNAPTITAATSTGIANATVITFTPPSSDGGADITDYEYTINDGGSWTAIASTTSPVIVGGLTACTEYSIKIRAVNAAGGGTASSAATVTPQNGQKAGINWTSRSSAADNLWSSVTYGNGLFVAVALYNSSFGSTNNSVMTSPDGLNWTIRTAQSSPWESVTYGNGLFVAVGSTQLMTSPDGITWTLISKSTNPSLGDNLWKSITYGNGLFVAVANNGSGGRVLTSADGVTWSQRTAAAAISWNSVTYGNGLFVAVANSGTGNRVMTSPDGITWTARSSVADNNWLNICYGNGLFVAVANTGTGNRVMTSPDGATWTARSSFDNSWFSIFYDNGLFVALGSSVAMTSEDGITWTSRTTQSNTWRSVICGNGLFVAVAGSGSGNRVMTSSDAMVPGTPAISSATQTATSASVVFTAPASSGYAAITNYQYSIDNGLNWVTRSPAATTSPLAITGLTSGSNYQIRLRAVNSIGSGCGSEAVSTCVNPTSGGTIAAAQSGGSGFNPAAFTSSAAASGHTGTLEYKWQSSTTSSSAGFSDIASSNFDTYDAGVVTQTTWYKRMARVDCNSNWTGAAESNVLEVTIIPMASQPTAQPTALYFTTTGTNPYNFVGKFTASGSATGYLVVRNTGSAPTFTPADGTEYTTGSQTGGVIVYSGALATFTESSVTSNVRYFYAIYAFNGSGSSINYLTTSPLNGSALRSTTGSGSVPASATGTSVSFPTSGVTVNFPGGTPGTNLTVSKSLSAPSSNFQVNSSIRGKKPMYFTITSSSRTPGVYTLILDFSGLGPLTNAQWNSYKITKRKNARSPWVDITRLGATIVSRNTDGVMGKFTIRGLSSFSEFGLDEVYDGVLTTNLDQTTTSTPYTVNASTQRAQSFVTDGIRYDLSKLKVSVILNDADLRARLYGSNVDGTLNTTTILTTFNTPSPLSGNVYELTPQTPVKLEPNTQYWVVFYSANNPVNIDYTTSATETGPASFPGNYSSLSSNAGSTFSTPNTDPPALFSIEATEVIRTWTGGSSTVWSAAGNWNPAETPGNGEIMTIPNVDNDPVLDANISPANLIVESGTVLNMGDKNITLTQGFINDGSLTSTTGKLILAGTSAQGIVGTGSISRLEVNNIEGVFISGDDFMQTITGKLTPTLGILTTNDNLTLLSDINGTARVGEGSASGGYISGDVITQRYLSRLTGTGRNGRAWRLVTIPVTGSGTLRDVFMAGQSGADLTISTNRDAQPNDLGTVVIGHNQPDAATANGLGYDWIGIAGQVSSLRYYVENPTSGSFASSQVPNLNTTTYSTAEEGYMLFARGDRQQDYTIPGRASATVLQATGALKQGTIDVAIPALASAGYVLVGNPYMAVLDLEKVILDNATVIDNTVYVWDANIDGNAFKQGGYRAVTRMTPGAWTATGGATGSNPQYIESGSAFFVKPTASGGTLSIKESHKVDGTPGIAPHSSMTDGPSRLFINLEVTDTATRRLVDGAVAFFDTTYKEGLGDAVDIETFANISSGAIGLRQTGRRLAMEGRPWPADSAARSIPVDMRNLGTDAYLLRIIATHMSKEGFTAWLKDRHLNKETALKTDDETLYPFRRTGDLGIDSSRFEIVYRLSKPTNTGTITPDEAAGGIAPRLYPNPAKAADVKLSLGSLAPGRYEVQVVDMSGRLVLTKTLEHLSVKGEYRFLQGRKLAPGTYTIRLSDAYNQLKETLRLVVD